MLSPEGAAKTLLRWAPYSAPITWRQLALATGASSPAAARRLAKELHMGRGGWASAGIYEHHRKGRGWPPALALVTASMAELLEGRRPPRQRPASGPLEVRPASAGDRYRTWNYGRRSPDSHADRPTIGTHRLAPSSSLQVLVAHEGRRLVGSAVFRFVDTLDDEQTDVPEIVGNGSVGPIFVKGDDRWGGHAIVMESMWVAPDRRRAGIATALGAQIAKIGLPAWGAFRDPWFAAFFLDRWPPTKSMRKGSYWPWWEEYAEATQWADEEETERVELDMTVWVSQEERAEYDAAVEDNDPAGHLDYLLSADDGPRSGVSQGGWNASAHDVTVSQARGGWRMNGKVSLECIPELLMARAALNRFLAQPLDAPQPVDDLREAVELTAVAAARRYWDATAVQVERWELLT